VNLRRSLAALILTSSLASGYYHFIRFSSRNAPFNPIVEKFDLAVLPEKTLTFQIAENGPVVFATGDSFPALVSQIRAAARVWSEVETSELRLRFGGLFSPGQPVPATPGVDVVFEELPPGVNGYGSVTVRGDQLPGSNFVPIQRSQIVLNRNLANRPSWGTAFFLTAVHEFGHALGLQHSFTSGAMATEVTRGTTKIRPITPDDAAGISVLYPTPAFRQQFGAITGRVTAGNDGIAMASVVAIAPRGAAISALTNPDGTFRIEGLPPGQYYVYAHPLPAALQGEPTPGNILPPVDSTGRPFDFGSNFDTLFFPASRSPFVTVSVVAGEPVEGINFSVTRRTTPGIHSIQTYSFPGQFAVKPAQLYSIDNPRNFLVASGVGLVQNNQPVPGLQISTLGGFATVPADGIRPYSPSPGFFLEARFQFAPFAQDGPGHLLFTRGTDLYVLPNALRLAQRPAPQVDSVTLRPEDGAAVVTGRNFAADTRIHFDGIAATHRTLDDQGRLIVSLPPAFPGHRAAVAAFNSDGQSSLFVQSPFEFVYEGVTESAITAGVSLSTLTLPAGTESLIEITAPQLGATAEGALQAGFNSGDIQVRRLWTTANGRILANVWVSPSAAGTTVSLTVSNGLRLLNQTNALQITASPARLIQASLPPGVSGLVPGTAGQLLVQSPQLAGSPTVSLNGQAATVISYDGGILTFAVPANLPAGPIAVRVGMAGEVGLPLGVQVLPPPALITSVIAGINQIISEARPARPGEILTVTVSGLPESISAFGSSPRLTLSVGGIEHRTISVNALGTAVQFQFILQNSVPTGNLPLNVTIDGVSATLPALPVRGLN
jgi:hypothetical protein